MAFRHSRLLRGGSIRLTRWPLVFLAPLGSRLPWSWKCPEGVEWYRKDLARYGKPVTDAEAQAWVTQTKTYNPNYLVFLKHWLTEKMPPTYRTGLVFIDDSQGHGSLSNMVNEFTVWGQTFAPAPVGFQYGYQSDKTWWSNLADPPRTIGNALLANIPNTRDLLWVDF